MTVRGVRDGDVWFVGMKGCVCFVFEGWVCVIRGKLIRKLGQGQTNLREMRTRGFTIKNKLNYDVTQQLLQIGMQKKICLD